MFKLVAIFAFVATCSASSSVGWTNVLGLSQAYYVDVGYNHIKIANQQGDVVNFVVDNFYGYNGPQNFLVQFYGQSAGAKSVPVYDQQSQYSGRSQSDILYQIFNDYDGSLDEIEYQKLINIISTYVQNGQVAPAVLYALQALAGQYGVLGYLDQYQGQFPRYQGQVPRYQGAWSSLQSGYGWGSYSPYSKPGYSLGGYYGPYSGTYATYGQSYPQQYYGGYKYGSAAYPGYGYQWGSYYPQYYQQSYGGYYPYAAKLGQYGFSYPSYLSGASYGPYASAFKYAGQYAW